MDSVSELKRRCVWECVLSYVVWVIYFQDLLLNNLGCVSQKRHKRIVENIGANGANGVYNLLKLTALLENSTLASIHMTITFTSLFFSKSVSACL